MALHLLLALASLPAPQEPDHFSATILDEFATHRIVAIGENHGHREFHTMVLQLLERPSAIAVIDDVAVEWGNSLYQGVVDRFVTGAAVPWDSVTMAWRNTVVSPNTVWDSPVYERFFRAMRRINSALPPEDQYRVLLADPPVDWSKIQTRDQLTPYFDRARVMADVIRKESLLKGRRSLFLAGGLHVSRLPRVRPNALGIPVSEITPVAWLELRHPGVTFVVQSMGRIGPVDPDDSQTAGTAPVLIEAEGSALGGALANSLTTLRDRDGSAPDVYGTARLADIVDAVILWGESERTFEDPKAETYRIDWYWHELNRRSVMLRGEPMDSSLRAPEGDP